MRSAVVGLINSGKSWVGGKGRDMVVGKKHPGGSEYPGGGNDMPGLMKNLCEAGSETGGTPGENGVYFLV